MPKTADPIVTGPLDVVVIGFGGGPIDEGIGAALRELSAAGTVAIIDMAYITRSEDGTTASAEVPDSPLPASFHGLDRREHSLIGAEDLLDIAEDLPPGAAAVVIVWANSWADRLARAVDDADGRLICYERLVRPDRLSRRAAERAEATLDAG